MTISGAPPTRTHIPTKKDSHPIPPPPIFRFPDTYPRPGGIT